MGWNMESGAVVGVATSLLERLFWSCMRILLIRWLQWSL